MAEPTESNEVQALVDSIRTDDALQPSMQMFQAALQNVISFESATDLNSKDPGIAEIRDILTQQLSEAQATLMDDISGQQKLDPKLLSMAMDQLTSEVGTDFINGMNGNDITNAIPSKLEGLDSNSPGMSREGISDPKIDPAFFVEGGNNNIDPGFFVEGGKNNIDPGFFVDGGNNNIDPGFAVDGIAGKPNNAPNKLMPDNIDPGMTPPTTGTELNIDPGMTPPVQGSATDIDPGIAPNMGKPTQKAPLLLDDNVIMEGVNKVLGKGAEKGENAAGGFTVVGQEINIQNFAANVENIAKMMSKDPAALLSKKEEIPGAEQAPGRSVA